MKQDEYKNFVSHTIWVSSFCICATPKHTLGQPFSKPQGVSYFIDHQQNTKEYKRLFGKDSHNKHKVVHLFFEGSCTELVFESQSDSDSNSTDSTLSRISSLTLSQLLVPQVSVSLCMKTQFPILIRSLCVSKFFSSSVPYFD